MWAHSQMDHPKDYSKKVWSNWLSNFTGEDFYIFFPIGSYVKTMLADGSHLGWEAGNRIQFWKGTTVGPFSQSLIPICQAVSEKILNIFPIESIMLKICPLMAAILVGMWGHRIKLWKRTPPKDHSIKVGFQLAKQFQTRRFSAFFP